MKQEVAFMLEEMKKTFEGMFASTINGLLELYKQDVPLGVTVISKEELVDVGRVVHLTGEGSVEIDLLSGSPGRVSEEFGMIFDWYFRSGDAYQDTLKGILVRNLVELLKRTHEGRLQVRDMSNTIKNERNLKAVLEMVKEKKEFGNIVRFFEREILDNESRTAKEALETLYIELEMLNKALGVQEDPLDIQKHFEKGGVLNIVVGEESLFKAPTIVDVLAHFSVLKIQNAILNDCDKPFEVPHFVFIENYSKYKNPDMEFIIRHEMYHHRIKGVSFNYTI